MRNLITTYNKYFIQTIYLALTALKILLHHVQEGKCIYWISEFGSYDSIPSSFRCKARSYIIQLGYYGLSTPKTCFYHCLRAFWQHFHSVDAESNSRL
mmetsp:Transcript_27087/g.35111  ORF Transcript_27087/g.35111 Transcript_27087/m.35111 type:complete len:98 (-) Transcript_27087:799-1092(-)